MNKASIYLVFVKVGNWKEDVVNFSDEQAVLSYLGRLNAESESKVQEIQKLSMRSRTRYEIVWDGCLKLKSIPEEEAPQ